MSGAGRPGRRSEAAIRPRVTFGIIVLNGEPFVRYNLRSLYPFAHQIIVVEGACPAAAAQSTPNGHSRDGTLETIRRFLGEEDKDGKVQLITAEDEGKESGFWHEKEEMSAAYAKRATGDYLWQVDIDEFYLPGSMAAVLEMLQADPAVSAASFRTLTFWGGMSYRTDGAYLRGGADQFRRLFKWGEGYTYAAHRPPTVLDASGVSVHEKKPLSAATLARKGIYLHHYELLFPKQVLEKCSYYTDVPWTDTLRSASDWASSCYKRLGNPFRVHMVYDYASWLERFQGPHPPEVVRMVKDVEAGHFPDIRSRKNRDVEELLSDRVYGWKVTALRSRLYFARALAPANRQIRSAIATTPLGPPLRRIRRRIRSFRGTDDGCVSSDYVRIRPNQVTPDLLTAWQSDAIVAPQRALVDRELQQMYSGEAIRPFRVFAEAVRATGLEKASLLEIGCASGHYSEVLRHLLGSQYVYEGLDYSTGLIEEARRRNPGVAFAVANATDLPYPDASFDIAISGCVILHMTDWQQAIRESARVARDWVILHRTPMAHGGTEYYTKRAYGQKCVEIHFGRSDLQATLETSGLEVVRELPIDEHTITFVCKKV